VFVECDVLSNNRGRDEVQTAIRNYKAGLRSVRWDPASKDLVAVAGRFAGFCEQFPDGWTMQHLILPMEGFVIQSALAAKWIDAMLVLLRTAKPTDSSRAKRIELHPTDDEAFVEMCAQLGSSDPDGEFWRTFHTTRNLQHVELALVTMAANGKSGPQHGIVLKVAKAVLGDGISEL